MHDDEIEIGDDLVRRLIGRDLPQFADLPLRRLAASGSSNVLFRLGRDYLVRLPRQPGGSRSVETEARWLARLAPKLPVVVPEVVAVGEPGFGYSERWTLTRWIDGRLPATPVPPGAAANALAADLAAFVTALHTVEVPDQAAADPNLRWYRGGPLSSIDASIRQYLEDCRRLPDLPLDVDGCLEVWAAAVELPLSNGINCWLHADLVAENVLLRDDRLVAVLDFGGLTVGDPSVDLVVAWEVLEPEAREVFRECLDVDDMTWLRGRGWALAIAAMTFPYYWTSMPARCTARLAMAQQVLADAFHR
ncbi:MAG TPA: aminoglycoside phosphotransferase family protein [Jatrophihabitans sp.]|nr:aminoglycoside phosphotransferase family protein [Jatrophihabitans sp.]